MGDKVAATPVTSTGAGYGHRPVMVEEVATLLSGCRRVLDGTVGAGGHAARLVASGAEVLGLDRDPAAVSAARAALRAAGAAGRARVREGDYAAAAAESDVLAFRPDGVLLDLGVSSPQLDDAGRGFSFRPGTALDMRFGGDGPTAAQWLDGAGERELASVFRAWGDERRARALASEIARRRATRPFRTSDDLVGTIRAVLGPRSGPGDFARLFQAVRIAVNDELDRLARGLPALLELLEPGGVLAVICYHSGEDRQVKSAFREWARECICPPEQPACSCRGRALGTLLTRRAVVAGAREVAANPRSRSARLRAFRKAEPAASGRDQAGGAA